MRTAVEGRSATQTAKEAAKEVICGLVAASGGTLRGKLRLNKAFYFAHLFYWREAADVLTDYPVVRLPNGPAIDQVDGLLSELVAEKRLVAGQVWNGPYRENVYRLAIEGSADTPYERATPQMKAIHEAIQFVEGRTAAELSELTHEHSFSWQTTPDGSELNIYLDVLPDEQRAEIEAALAEMRAGQ